MRSCHPSLATKKPCSVWFPGSQTRVTWESWWGGREAGRGAFCLFLVTIPVSLHCETGPACAGGLLKAGHMPHCVGNPALPDLSDPSGPSEPTGSRSLCTSSAVDGNPEKNTHVARDKPAAAGGGLRDEINSFGFNSAVCAPVTQTELNPHFL